MNYTTKSIKEMKPISGVKSCIYIIRKKGVVCIAEKELIWMICLMIICMISTIFIHVIL